MPLEQGEVELTENKQEVPYLYDIISYEISMYLVLFITHYPIARVTHHSLHLLVLFLAHSYSYSDQ